MRSAVISLSLACASVACEFEHGFLGRDASLSDTRSDTTDVSSDVRSDDSTTLACPWPYTPLYVDPCNPGNPTAGALDLASGNHTYDTDTGVLTDPANNTSTPPNSSVGGSRIVWTTRFTMVTGSNLRATGSLPLVVVSSSMIDIAGTIDVSSFWTNGGAAFSSGAGANPGVCPTNPPGAGRVCAQHAGSGGGGAGFGGTGGVGGEGGDGRDCGGVFTSGIPGGAGGLALGSYPTLLRGGCPGRDGSQNDSGTADRGRGGPGGGAVQLVARDMLSVSGVIHAGGSGGTHGIANRSGGGGGGTGGMIGLEATNLEVTSSGVLAANGGGGGGGCDNAPATPGENGQPSDQVAQGGAKQNTGSDGGNGGFATTPAQSAGVGERGGGGGGGGVGFIKLRAMSVTQDGTDSPPPTP